MINQSKIFKIVLVGLYIIIFITISQNLRSAYLWFDESVQFWISQGLNPDSDPFSPKGSVVDVVENNKYYNLDPGGFGIILHYWSGISNHHIWLRLLPFIFFIGTIVLFIYLAYSWFENINIALLVGLLPIYYPMTLNVGFLIRAYSMEALGAVLCIIAARQLTDVKSNKIKFLIWGVVLSVFVTSRYSAIIPVFVTVVFILLVLLKENTSLINKLISAACLTFPLLITIYLVYSHSLVFQNPGAAPVEYIEYISQNVYLIVTPPAIIYLLSLLFFTCVYVMRKRYKAVEKYEHLLLISLGVNYLFILLSVLGKYPWIPPFTDRSNRCISMIILMMLCYSAFLGELILRLSPQISKYYLIVLVLFFVVYLRIEKSLINIYPILGDISTIEAKSEISKFDRNNFYYNISDIDIAKFRKIHVDVWQTPCVKYLYEYGALSTDINKIYPQNFTFTKSGRHGFYKGTKVSFGSKDLNPHTGEYKNYDLLIGEWLPEDEWDNMEDWVHLEGKDYLWVRKEE